jgi:hypothetical protein
MQTSSTPLAVLSGASATSSERVSAGGPDRLVRPPLPNALTERKTLNPKLCCCCALSCSVVAQVFPPLPDAPTELIPLVSYAPEFGSKSFYSHDAPSSDYDYSSQADDVNLDDVIAMEAESSGPLLTHRGPAATSSSSTPRQQLLPRQQQGHLRQQQQQSLQQQRGVGAVGSATALSRGNGGGVVMVGGADVPLGGGS